MRNSLLLFLLPALFYNCSSSQSESGMSDTNGNKFTGAKDEVKLMTVDPGHFHAALVQKFMYEQVDSVVHVYAPKGEDLQLHLDRIEQFNTREDNPTHWVEKVHTGEGFFQQMLNQKPGNVVVLSGNNAKKTEYIKQSVEAGLNVLADKPMVIEPEEYSLLKEAFAIADEKNVLLYDIMTERFEITTILQKELAQFPDVFGKLVKGTPEEPAISKESVHHFFKEVAGKPLVRPAWFFDVKQQGEGMVDVSTHLVDLILWECFPGEGIDTTEVEVLSARHWPTALTPAQFRKVTAGQTYPDYLKSNVVKDSLLNVYSNGEFVFTTRGVHGKVSVIWNFEAPEGAADTHYSIMRGDKANLIIRQDEAQNYKPTLYVEPLASADKQAIGEALEQALEKIGEKYPGITAKPSSAGWEIVIPEEYKNGHEAHFAQVTENYLKYLTEGAIPAWEKQNMLTKYFITTTAYKMSR